MVANTNETNKLWHQHLGHTNFVTLHHIGRLSMVDGFLQFKLPSGVCEGCMLGEHQHEYSLKDLGQASHPLELGHSDICEPMTTPSLGGAKYLLTFIDDCSRFLWMYTIQSKHEVC
jgi:hypothetical protein